MVDLTSPQQRLDDEAAIQTARAEADAVIQQLIETLANTSDPMQAAVAATEALTELEERRSRLSHVRAEVMRRALRDGWGVQQIADHLGISRSRVDQIVNDR